MAPLDTENILRTSVTAIIAIVMIVIVAGLNLTGVVALEPTVGTQQISDEIPGAPSNLDAEATRGYGLSFQGSDYVRVPSQNFTNGSWTVCTAAELRDQANQNLTYNAFAWGDGDLLLQYDAGEWAIYYENASGADGRASLPAPTPADSLTPVCGRYNASTDALSLMREGAVSAPSPLTANVTPRNLSESWNGTLDEVRTFNGTVNNSTLQQWAQDPIVPLPQTNRTARYMFDDGEGSSTAAYFVGGTVGIDGTAWTDGVDKPGLQRGTDYEFKESPLRLVIPQGSYLTGAPVVWVTWGRFGLADTIIDFIPVMMGVLVIVFIADRADLL